jgi:hypothetical protein
MLVGRPVNYYGNFALWLRILLVVLAGVNMLAFHLLRIASGGRGRQNGDAVGYAAARHAGHEPEHAIRFATEHPEKAMKRCTRRIAMAGVATLLIGGSMVATVRQSAAHHSMAMYDQQRTVTVIGTVIEFRWNNPHVYVLVNGTVGMDDDPAEWWLETAAPSGLMRFGWSATSLRPGDLVSVVVNPHRDPSQKVALILSVTLIDTGQELSTGAALFSP